MSLPASSPASTLRLSSLRTDLLAHSEPTAEGWEWVLEDPLRGEYFHLGEEEFLFANQLRPDATLTDILSECQRQLPSFRLTPAEALQLIDWLLKSHLLADETDSASQRLAREHTSRRSLRRWRWLNLFCVKIPLWKPGRELDQLTKLTSWFFSPWLTILVVSCIVGIFTALWQQRSEFSASIGSIFVPQQTLWLLAAWIGLKIVHEAGHAIVCRRYGGDVREAGVLLILFVPAAYVDVSSAWRFPNRWQRIHTSLAGMYVELTIAALAGWAWMNGDQAWWRDLAAQIVLLSSLSTLLTNLNPLARFDGYFILADFLRMPNLSERGQQALKDGANRWLLGVSVPVESQSPTQQTGLVLYGLGAFAWRLTVSFSLVIAAATMFQGVGIILAAAAVLLWFILPLMKTIRYLLVGNAHGAKPNLIRGAAIAFPALALLYVFATFIPLPGSRYQPGIVEFLPETIVRAETAGFIRAVHVHEGEEVAAGTLLCELENDTLHLQLLKAKNECTQLEAQLRRLQAQGRSAEGESLLAEWNRHQRQHEELLAEQDKLRVVAPHSGRVIARRFQDRLGTYVPAGEELLVVADHSDKQLRVSWTASELQAMLPDGEATEVEVRLSTGRFISGNVIRIEPRGQVIPSHPALCSPFGGPLAARRVGESLELLEPRFDVLLSLPHDSAAALQAGELLFVRQRRAHTSLAEGVHRWLRRQTPEFLSAVVETRRQR